MLPLFLLTLPDNLLLLGTFMCFINVDDWYSNNVTVIGALLVHISPVGYMVMIYGLTCYLSNRILIYKIKGDECV